MNRKLNFFKSFLCCVSITFALLKGLSPAKASDTDLKLNEKLASVRKKLYRLEMGNLGNYEEIEKYSYKEYLKAYEIIKKAFTDNETQKDKNPCKPFLGLESDVIRSRLKNIIQQPDRQKYTGKKIPLKDEGKVLDLTAAKVLNVSIEVLRKFLKAEIKNSSLVKGALIDLLENGPEESFKKINYKVFFKEKAAHIRKTEAWGKLIQDGLGLLNLTEKELSKDCVRAFLRHLSEDKGQPYDSIGEALNIAGSKLSNFAIGRYKKCSPIIGPFKEALVNGGGTFMGLNYIQFLSTRSDVPSKQGDFLFEQDDINIYNVEDPTQDIESRLREVGLTEKAMNISYIRRFLTSLKNDHNITLKELEKKLGKENVLKRFLNNNRKSNGNNGRRKSNKKNIVV